MDKMLKLFLVIGFFAVVFVLVQLKHSSADSNNFSGVIPLQVKLANGNAWAFFDKNTGKLYIYQSVKPNEIECDSILQVNELGKPLSIIYKKNPSLNLF